MGTVRNMIKNSWAVLAALFLSGCLVSGTFVIVETFTFTAPSGLYFYAVDLTTDSDWQSHKDDIDFIDAVGFEFFISSNETPSVTFNVWIDGASGATNPTTVPTTASKVINGLTVAPGISKIDYAKSLTVLTNVDRLKTLAKTGVFDVYANSSGGTGSNFVVDSARVIVTVSASGS